MTSVPKELRIKDRKERRKTRAQSEKAHQANIKGWEGAGLMLQAD